MAKLHITVIPEMREIDYDAKPGERFDEALESLGFIPDCMLIFSEKTGKSIPQDEIIEEDSVRIFPTSSRG